MYIAFESYFACLRLTQKGECGEARDRKTLKQLPKDNRSANIDARYSIKQHRLLAATDLELHHCGRKRQLKMTLLENYANLSSFLLFAIFYTSPSVSAYPYLSKRSLQVRHPTEQTRDVTEFDCEAPWCNPQDWLLSTSECQDAFHDFLDDERFPKEGDVAFSRKALRGQKLPSVRLPIRYVRSTLESEQTSFFCVMALPI